MSQIGRLSNDEKVLFEKKTHGIATKSDHSSLSFHETIFSSNWLYKKSDEDEIHLNIIKSWYQVTMTIEERPLNALQSVRKSLFDKPNWFTPVDSLPNNHSRHYSIFGCKPNNHLNQSLKINEWMETSNDSLVTTMWNVNEIIWLSKFTFKFVSFEFQKFDNLNKFISFRSALSPAFAIQLFQTFERLELFKIKFNNHN